MPAREEERELRVEIDVGAPLASLRNHRGRVARQRGRARQTAEGALDVREGRLGLEVADDHEGQVVRGVVGVEESLAGFDRHLLDVAAPADHRPAIGMGLPDQGRERFEAATVGRVLGPQPPLLEDHFALALERLVVDHEIEEALGLEVDHEGQRLRGHVLVVDRHVTARIGVDPATALVDELGMDFLADVLRPLEHHVLEEVGDPGMEGLVRGARVHPELDGDDRRPVVLEQDDAEAVVETGLEHRLRGIADPHVAGEACAGDSEAGDEAADQCGGARGAAGDRWQGEPRSHPQPRAETLERAYSVCHGPDRIDCAPACRGKARDRKHPGPGNAGPKTATLGRPPRQQE